MGKEGHPGKLRELGQVAAGVIKGFSLMPRRTHLRGRFQLLATFVATIVQLPVVLWLCLGTHTPVPALGAALISFPYLRQLQSPWHSTGPSPSTYLALGWWASCLVFDLLMLPATLAIRAGAPMAAAWGVAGIIALALGADAVLGRPRLRRRVVRVEGLSPESVSLMVDQCEAGAKFSFAICRLLIPIN